MTRNADPSTIEKWKILARIAHTLTICARDTYEVGTDKVLEPEVLRAYNEVLHRVTGTLMNHLQGTKGYSLEDILEMLQFFGDRYRQAHVTRLKQEFFKHKNDSEPNL